MKKSAAGFLRAFFARLRQKKEGSVLRHASSGLVRGCVHTNRPRYASIRFAGLEGRSVFRLRSKADGERLVCAASLGEGKARVRLDVNGQEKLWFALSGGGQEEQALPVPAGTVYVTVESLEPCRGGRFVFSLDGFPGQKQAKYPLTRDTEYDKL